MVAISLSANVLTRPGSLLAQSLRLETRNVRAICRPLRSGVTTCAWRQEPSRTGAINAKGLPPLQFGAAVRRKPLDIAPCILTDEDQHRVTTSTVCSATLAGRMLPHVRNNPQMILAFFLLFWAGKMLTTALDTSQAAGPAPSPSMTSVQECWKDKERCRKHRRDVYTFNHWVKHRASNRYFYHLFTMFMSKNMFSLLGTTGVITSVAAVLVAMEVLAKASTLPVWFPAISTIPALNPLPFTLISPLLALMLVFRTNSSYGRWDEARKMWGLMVNRTRDVVRQGFRWFDERDEALKDQFMRYTIALPRSMMVHLRADESLKQQLGHILTEDEFARLEAAPHRPIAVLQMMGAIVARAKLSNMQQVAMDVNLTAFEDVLGGSERILRTPIPVSYTRITSRLLISYLLLLPFAMVPILHLAAIPATFLLAFFFLAVDEVGVQLEEPFSILPLEVISKTIEDNIRASRVYDKENMEELVVASVRDDVKISLSNGVHLSSNGLTPFPADNSNGQVLDASLVSSSL